MSIDSTRINQNLAVWDLATSVLPDCCPTFCFLRKYLDRRLKIEPLEKEIFSNLFVYNLGMNQSNSEDIASWSLVSQLDIKKFGDDGDPARQLLLTPTIFELIGNVKDKSVLDAGCGTGYLARKLAREGAIVTGIEPAKSFFENCVQREKEDKLGITYLQDDLSEFDPSKFAFDLVVSNMVFMDIANYQRAMLNCIKSLKNGRLFVFSISHPCFPGSDKDWQKLGYVKISEYFNRKPQKNNFGSSYDRPIQNYVNFLIANGCDIVQMVEPQISKEVAEEDKNWDRNYHVPQFLFISARKK